MFTHLSKYFTYNITVNTIKPFITIFKKVNQTMIYFLGYIVYLFKFISLFCKLLVKWSILATCTYFPERLYEELVQNFLERTAILQRRFGVLFVKEICQQQAFREKLAIINQSWNLASREDFQVPFRLF